MTEKEKQSKMIIESACKTITIIAFFPNLYFLFKVILKKMFFRLGKVYAINLPVDVGSDMFEFHFKEFQKEYLKLCAIMLFSIFGARGYALYKAVQFTRKIGWSFAKKFDNEIIA